MVGADEPRTFSNFEALDWLPAREKNTYERNSFKTKKCINIRHATRGGIGGGRRSGPLP